MEMMRFLSAFRAKKALQFFEKGFCFPKSPFKIPSDSHIKTC